MKKPEAHLQKQICTYLKMQYPSVIFLSECSGLKVSIGVAMQLKALRSGKALPDLVILEPSGNYHALCLELKAESIYLKDGSLSKEKHIQEQNEILNRLNEKGFKAQFCCGFDYTKSIIDNYLRK
jgi:hypothetical protein